jgi:hypothetical protein
MFSPYLLFHSVSGVFIWTTVFFRLGKFGCDDLVRCFWVE